MGERARPATLICVLKTIHRPSTNGGKVVCVQCVISRAHNTPPDSHSRTVATLALIAHDGKKAEMMAFAIEHQDQLAEFGLVATGTTGQLLSDRVGLDIDRQRSGPLGGDVQIAAKIVEGIVDGVLFFVDEMDKHPHDPDIRTLLRTCAVHDVPLATNLATARLVLAGLPEREAVE
ncbi:MAG: methylglyoxal synthase [Bacteroidetes bacterium QH_8_67_23]|nr:MAG: methylglyoxal synthase [Bacteroidetes bacterium QH_8_67_23]